ncbi:MAG: hypothetical protein IPH07_06445 [Deltaproteobacteria bacterium]|jgi:hypothetical protein|nr:hypothetical protein [Deltaproteobacteria bacterium]
MAHILVYLQRTPQGLHPASAVALCLARDLGSERGATVTAMCAGDAGELDRAMVSAAGRHGADVMVFCGPGGIERLQQRLSPVHTLVPWTAEGIAAASGLVSGAAIPRWVDARRPDWGSPDATSGIVAGVLPWHDFDEQLEAEYQGDVDQVPMPAWVAEVPPPVGAGGTDRLIIGEPQLRYVAPDAIDHELRAKLAAVGAKPTRVEDVALATIGHTLWLQPGAGPLPDALAHRGPGSRVLLLPGPDGTLDATWALADWVLPGAWPDVLAALQTPAWRRALT